MSPDSEALAQTVLSAVLAYGGLVLLLRISGKRTLSKWNAFDFVVTVALGSSLATVILTSEVSLTQGLLAFAMLIALQLAVTWLSVRLRVVERLAKSTPALLLYQGELQRSAMKRERVTESEVRTALRGRGIGALEEAAAVVLETDGSFSVIRAFGDKRATALSDVAGFEPYR